MTARYTDRGVERWDRERRGKKLKKKKGVLSEAVTTMGNWISILGLLRII